MFIFPGISMISMKSLLPMMRRFLNLLPRPSRSECVKIVAAPRQRIVKQTIPLSSMNLLVTNHAINVLPILRAPKRRIVQDRIVSFY